MKRFTKYLMGINTTVDSYQVKFKMIDTDDNFVFCVTEKSKHTNRVSLYAIAVDHVNGDTMFADIYNLNNRRQSRRITITLSGRHVTVGEYSGRFNRYDCCCDILITALQR